MNTEYVIEVITVNPFRLRTRWSTEDLYYYKRFNNLIGLIVPGDGRKEPRANIYNPDTAGTWQATLIEEDNHNVVFQDVYNDYLGAKTRIEWVVRTLESIGGSVKLMI